MTGKDFMLSAELTTYLIKIHFYLRCRQTHLIRTNQTWFDVNRGTISTMNFNEVY